MKRDTFIFRKDWKEAIVDLPDEVRLEFYDSISDYAFEGEIQVLKPLASVAFNFAKRTIDRDFEKWDDTKEQKSNSGSLGNLKRWNADIYNSVVAGKISLEEGLNIAEHRKRRTAINPVAEIANVAICISDSISDNVLLKKENDKSFSKKTKSFQIPTIEEVKSYCTERKNNVDAERWHNYYASNGWKIGGKAPMKDWQAAVRTWEKNNYNNKNNGNTTKLNSGTGTASGHSQQFTPGTLQV